MAGQVAFGVAPQIGGGHADAGKSVGDHAFPQGVGDVEGEQDVSAAAGLHDCPYLFFSHTQKARELLYRKTLVALVEFPCLPVDVNLERVDPGHQGEPVAVQDAAARPLHRLCPEVDVPRLCLEILVAQDLHLDQAEDEQEGGGGEDQR